MLNKFDLFYYFYSNRRVYKGELDMVGLIQKILIDMIKGVSDEKTLIEIKKLAGLPIDKEFQINLVYSDEEWHRLLKATHKILKVTPEQADVIYAEYFLKDALHRFPTWFDMSKNSYELLLIQPTIHNCFATGVANKESRDAINDKFRVEKLQDKIITHYKSPNGHCNLYKELAKSVINHYHDEATIDEKSCMKLGADECEIHIEWTKLGT